MRTFPSAIIRLVGRLEVMGSTGTCVLCKQYVDKNGHEDDCPVLAALKEAEKIAEDVTSEPPMHVPFNPNEPQVWYGTGPVTCKLPTADVQIPQGITTS